MQGTAAPIPARGLAPITPHAATLESCPGNCVVAQWSRMAHPDPHPVAALVLAIPSTLGRFVVVWLTVSVFLAIPFLPTFGWEVLRNSFLWPIACIYGVVEWGGFPPPWTLGAMILPASMILGAWGYVMEVAPALSLWVVAHCSLMLTGPALLADDVSGWVPWIVALLWSLMSFRWYRVARRSGKD